MATPVRAVGTRRFGLPGCGAFAGLGAVDCHGGLAEDGAQVPVAVQRQPSSSSKLIPRVSRDDADGLHQAEPTTGRPLGGIRFVGWRRYIRIVTL